MTTYRNIDADKAHRSFTRLKGRQVRILQRHLLAAVDRVITARAFFDHSGDKTLLLRSLSEVYALNAVKRELQSEGY
jgi:acyl CoA:acetate/3-ketoacid CoA transferase beta subunit